MRDYAGSGGILGMLPALDGLRVQVAAPVDMDTTNIPPAGIVVGWVLVADVEAAGGARVDPVFLADGRAFTPDQYRAAYGQQLTVRVGRAQ
ncbi:hypothetical protein O3Q52_01660 [Streptomyces sp. ActVer]|uniref:hypothetical protein n=1 Tax=Streptomyces sp. ActVer TaxID=3014558 RepID=UPI0022B56B0B|nr:hypothetical protein [Streptomyces sp. ActVer]MCZ4506934.1 hypothetical protein [Streptomyces sp. ActVer]